MPGELSHGIPHRRLESKLSPSCSAEQPLHRTLPVWPRGRPKDGSVFALRSYPVRVAPSRNKATGTTMARSTNAGIASPQAE